MEFQVQPSRRGAGAILYSSLVSQGWKFPTFLLTDTDERYLFDLEVTDQNFYAEMRVLLKTLLGDPRICTHPIHGMFYSAQQYYLFELHDTLRSNRILLTDQIYGGLNFETRSR